ncbi:MAG TPA: PspC domain-containing protein [Jatrophihabitans sp.]|jgi:phage shock protein PspC (stress-responsive transcriptional regulator)|uniref:PspC domain-containing protein n=1 Tax=Jatrophihabitans sp. TaxID=1932789 RepID=UPI002DFE0596|nr:PspC domain-containing protein [Jatrophihabitans sp.]
MTMTDDLGPAAHDSGAATPPPAPAPHVLRRSRNGRVGAGVAAGLGDYFALDPVLFRVLFATSAFFGGAGIIAYLLAWAAIPEEGTERAPIDGWVGRLRRRRTPVWVMAVLGGLLLWFIAFSWWAPVPLFPVLAVVVILVVVFGRRDWQRPSEDAPTVSLTKDAAEPGAVEGGLRSTDRPQDPPWVNDARAWYAEARAARRRRRRRALPLRIGVLVGLVGTLTVLGIVDGVSGIALPTYFWWSLGIVGGGLLVGAALRRTPWSVSLLLGPTVLGLIAFGGSHASLHDGTGSRQWRPTTVPAGEYRLALGQGVLDLTKLAPQTAPRTIDVTIGAGEVQVIAPKSLDLTVDANVHIGVVRVDGETTDNGAGHGGWNYNRTIDPPAGATGQPITVVVHLADGQIRVDRR